MPRRKTTNESVLETAKRRAADRRVSSAQVAQAYRAGRKKLLSMLRRRLPMSNEHEDAFHDAIVKVLASDTAGSIVDVDGYLYVTVENVANDRYNERSPEELADHGKSEELSELRAQHLRSVEDNCMSNDILEKILEHLSPEESEAVRLVRLEGLTYREAAAAMSISKRRIETLLARAKARAMELSSLDPISGERK
jgi:RNA polymerase sigma factor (sigma-70 family)